MTFSKYIGPIAIPDISWTLTQTLTDDFNWKLGSADTPTADTGPSAGYGDSGRGLKHSIVVKEILLARKFRSKVRLSQFLWTQIFHYLTVRPIYQNINSYLSDK